MRQRDPRQHDETHLKAIRTLPCLVCRDINDTQTEAAHVKMPDLSVAKRFTGMSEKSHDMYAVPLCGAHHRAQHDCGNEREWWRMARIDPVKVGLALYAERGNYERQLAVVCGARDAA